MTRKRQSAARNRHFRLAVARLKGLLIAKGSKKSLRHRRIPLRPHGIPALLLALMLTILVACGDPDSLLEGGLGAEPTPTYDLGDYFILKQNDRPSL